MRIEDAKWMDQLLIKSERCDSLEDLKVEINAFDFEVVHTPDEKMEIAEPVVRTDIEKQLVTDPSTRIDVARSAVSSVLIHAGEVCSGIEDERLGVSMKQNSAVVHSDEHSVNQQSPVRMCSPTHITQFPVHRQTVSNAPKTSTQSRILRSARRSDRNKPKGHPRKTITDAEEDTTDIDEDIGDGEEDIGDGEEDICQRELRQVIRSKLVAGIDERTHVCPVCPARFKSLFDLRRHATTHGRNKIRVNMKKHSVDIKERPFACIKCSARFKLRWDLRRHSVVHSDRRAYSCTECKVSFKLAGELRRHLFTHAEEKPFPCSMCPATFIRCKSLLNHMKNSHSKTHTSEQPNRDILMESPHTSQLSERSNRSGLKEISYCETQIPGHVMPNISIQRRMLRRKPLRTYA